MKPFEEIVKEYQHTNSLKIQKLLESCKLFEILQSTYNILCSDKIKTNKKINIVSLVSNLITVSSNSISK